MALATGNLSTESACERPAASAVPLTEEWRKKTPKGGFSLLELMLVLGLLVIVAALAYPSVTGPLDNSRLRYAGEQVRACWARARTKAMESGRTYVFRCKPAGNTYIIEPWINNDDLLESDLVTQGGVAVGESAQEAAAVLQGPKEETLPENVIFVSSEIVAETRSQLLAATADSTTELDPTWSPPIFFYPDGTATTARLVLMNQRDRYMLVTLRGMTGVVTTRGLLTREELPQ
jgi:prepilin-type N-terminal cleavage/methylation domain-containing protein